ncbi:MAG: hypothetical protein ACFFC7_09115 [Candidatus Hermodarchaeota archaeon]
MVRSVADSPWRGGPLKKQVESTPRRTSSSTLHAAEAPLRHGATGITLRA